MKYVVLFIFVLTQTSSFAQDTTSAVQEEADMFSTDILYGHYFLKDDFKSQFNSQKHFSFSAPIQTLGISLSGAYVRDGRHDYAVHYSYSQVIPQKFDINDSISGRINGFILSINMLGKDLLPTSKIANCFIGLGINTGRFRIAANDYKHQKNPFFSPTLSIQPKIFLGPIVLSIRGDYGFDLSKKNWRSVLLTTKSEKINFSPLKQTGGIIYLSVGWIPRKGSYVLDLSKKK